MTFLAGNCTVITAFGSRFRLSAGLGEPDDPPQAHLAYHSKYDMTGSTEFLPWKVSRGTSKFCLGPLTFLPAGTAAVQSIESCQHQDNATVAVTRLPRDPLIKNPTRQVGHRVNIRFTASRCPPQENLDP